LNNGANLRNPTTLTGVEKSKVVPRSRSGIDPQTHVHVLERLVTTTAEAVENIPIFLELLDQPVKDPTLRPFECGKVERIASYYFGVAWRSIYLLCFCCLHSCPHYDDLLQPQTADQQLCLTLQHHLGSRETDDQRPRMPLNVLFSSYLPFWLGYSYPDDLWRTIAFLEPSDAADAELLWMVNTFHRTMHSKPASSA
jgi:hypothetical protein